MEKFEVFSEAGKIYDDDIYYEKGRDGILWDRSDFGPRARNASDGLNLSRGSFFIGRGFIGDAQKFISIDSCQFFLISWIHRDPKFMKF